MSTTTHAAIAEPDSNDDNQPNADAEHRLAVECVTCGTILPLDAIEPNDRDLIECPHCRRVRGPEVLLR